MVTYEDTRRDGRLSLLALVDKMEGEKSEAKRGDLRPIMDSKDAAYLGLILCWYLAEFRNKSLGIRKPLEEPKDRQ
ncbi:hypothetical protein H5410_016738 [Solanum commersonii]|uniref:Uncharacterized protein n=1 Tax=Solanum commersonii TaxID=4109 RepID=A0A9J5ZY55_SOLCO|nr:hypothetical protein H5410_016738 [Solanum commersonii]